VLPRFRLATAPVTEPAIAESLDRRARGDAIEAAARRYLQRAGLRDVACNARFRGGELDLVMHDGTSLVFIEVRYRRSADYGGAAASVDTRKQRKLVHAAQLFLASHRQFASAPCRFDVIVADGDPATPAITWLRDAFRADD
jgi:putative endonuclease